MTEDYHRPDEGHDTAQIDDYVSHLSGYQCRLEQFGSCLPSGPKLCTDGGVATGDDDENERDGGDDSTPIEGDPDVSLTPAVREFIRADRNNECELCGADGDQEAVTLAIHHRTEQGEGGTDHPENLLLLCQTCHRRHHNNLPVEVSNSDVGDEAVGKDTDPDDSCVDGEISSSGLGEQSDRPGGGDDAPEGTNTATGGDAEPLAPRSEPNGADREILRLLEDHGPLSTGELAAHTDLSSQYVRRQCWKLSGEQLIVPRTDNTWDLKERADEDTIRLGVPDDPDEAQRAGRDEVIRQMSAHGMTHTKIAEITDLSRGTIDVAVNRARALRIGESDDVQVDLATIATRLSALLELIDHAHTETSQQTD